MLIRTIEYKIELPDGSQLLPYIFDKDDNHEMNEMIKILTLSLSSEKELIREQAI